MRFRGTTQQNEIVDSDMLLNNKTKSFVAFPMYALNNVILFVLACVTQQYVEVIVAFILQWLRERATK